MLTSNKTNESYYQLHGLNVKYLLYCRCIRICVAVYCIGTMYSFTQFAIIATAGHYIMMTFIVMWTVAFKLFNIVMHFYVYITFLECSCLRKHTNMVFATQVFVICNISVMLRIHKLSHNSCIVLPQVLKNRCVDITHVPAQYLCCSTTRSSTNVVLIYHTF